MWIVSRTKLTPSSKTVTGDAGGANPAHSERTDCSYVVQVLVATLIVTVAASTISARAERMDEGTHNLLISKLERALEALPRASTERAPITLRLADLYADRARLKNLARGETKCTNCDDGSQDRKRAISLYEAVVERVGANLQGRVLLQMAHLYTQLGKTQQAITSLERVTRSKQSDREIVAKAHGNLGEIYFRQAQFQNAESHFRQALKEKTLGAAGFYTYRLAWAELNQGKSDAATRTLIRLLETPELMTIEAEGRVKFDQSFHDDVTRDLVLFLARGSVSKKEIDLLLSLTPERLRRENLYALANELERLGKKYSATLAWSAYNAEGDNSPQDAVETQIRTAQLQWDMGRKRQAAEEYSAATELWRKKGCRGDKCSEIAKRFKNFVTTWHKTEKDKPSELCLSAYRSYLSAFSQDAEMTFHAATVAEKNKKPAEAATLYSRAAQLSVDSEAGGAATADKNFLEASLLKEIESAELTRDRNMRLAAYDHYLNLNPDGAKATEVRYQKAHVTYEAGKTDEAFRLFSDLAVSAPRSAAERPLHLKAADLTLDALAIKKDDVGLIAWSERLLKHFPERANEFRKIQRQATLNIASRALTDNQSNSELRSALTRTQNLDLKNASTQDRVAIAKARIALAERLHDLKAVANAARELIGINGLKASDRELALAKLVWVAELGLEFKEALRLAKQMTLSHLKAEDRPLRLAMLSELAGQDPTVYYEKALKLTSSTAKANGIRATLVRRSSRPWQTLSRFEKPLRQSPELLSTLILEAFSRVGNQAKAKQFLARNNLTNSDLTRLFARRAFVTKWQELDRRISRSRIYSGSDALLDKTIRRRISMLNELDRLGEQSLALKDWVAQIVVLNSVRRENQRLRDELLTLPIPKILKGQDREKYQALLRQKSEPFAKRAKQAEVRLADFWSNDRALDDLAASYRRSEGRVRDLLASDLRVLAAIGDRAQRRWAESLINEPDLKPSSQEVAKLESRLKRDPFDREILEQLKKISESRGEGTKVAYYDARLTSLRQGARP